MVLKIQERLGEYFFRTLTKRYYDNHTAVIGEFSEYNCERWVRSVRKRRDKALLLSGYLPTVGDVLSVAGLASYFFTQNPKVIPWSIAGLVGSEIFRNIAHILDKNEQAAVEIEARMARTGTVGLNKVLYLGDQLKKNAKKRKKRRGDSDRSGYDGWLQPPY